jgi:hypothetical protein
MTALDQIEVADLVRQVGFQVTEVRNIDASIGAVSAFSRYEATHRYSSTTSIDAICSPYFRTFSSSVERAEPSVLTARR